MDNSAVPQTSLGRHRSGSQRQLSRSASGQGLTTSGSGAKSKPLGRSTSNSSQSALLTAAQYKRRVLQQANEKNLQLQNHYNKRVVQIKDKQARSDFVSRSFSSVKRLLSLAFRSRAFWKCSSGEDLSFTISSRCSSAPFHNILFLLILPLTGKIHFATAMGEHN